MQRERVQPDWLTLDNAARIYPASISDWSPDVYRVSVTLRAPIRVAWLAQALQAVLPRFPYFQVHLRRGLFWYYLQRDGEIPELLPLSSVPVSILPARGGRARLLQVMAGGATIAVDFSHILTDGAGAIRFLGTLALQYLEQSGVPITSWDPFFDPRTQPTAGEFEDAFDRFFEHGLPGPPALAPAYHLPQPAQLCSRVITGRLSVSGMIDLARRHQVSLTEYLVALYMHALATVRASAGAVNGRRDGGVLRIEVPVDMRRFYSTETMRNFSLYVSPEIDPGLGPYSFEDIVQQVHHSLRAQVEKGQLARQITRNVRAARHPLIRILPLALKDLLLAQVRERLGERSYSGVLTNLGRIEVPAAGAALIESFDVMLGPNPLMKTNCVVLSYRDDLTINLGSVIESRELERVFFTHLIQAGVRVRLTERSSAS